MPQTYARPREAGPVVPVRLPGDLPVWAVTTTRPCRKCFPATIHGSASTRRTGALRDGEVPKGWPFLPLVYGEHMLMRYGAEHRRLRAFVSRDFTPGRVAAPRPRIEEVVDQLVADIAARTGTVDLIAAFAEQLPMVVICELFGIPEPARPRLRTWTQALFSHQSTPEANHRAAPELFGYLGTLIQRKRERPEDDLASAMVRGTTEERLDDLKLEATSGNYAARTRRHARAVIRSFYECHPEMHGRPLVTPFPNARGADEEHPNVHHNPMRPFRRPSRRAAYQPKEPKPAPRSIPDHAFNELFAALDRNRDRPLVAFYISTGARASELLGVGRGLVVPEEQVIGVVRKGSRALQQLPASTDAFVWLRLYQQEVTNLVPSEAEDTLWWTLHRPFRPLTYDAMRMVFNKANAAQAVGNANGWNPISVVGPCHRVVGASGGLTGYAGGVDRKRFLVNLEEPPAEDDGRLF